MNEAALAHWGLSCQNKQKHFTLAHLLVSHLDYTVPIGTSDYIVWSLPRGQNAI